MHQPNIKELLKLYAEGKATEQQRRYVEEFMAWRAEHNPDADDDLEEEGSLDEILDRLDAARESTSEQLPVYEPDMEGIQGQFAGKVRRFRRYGWAAAVVITLVAGGWLWKAAGPRQETPAIAIVYKTVKARGGQTIHLLLSDSSEVWLSQGSSIRYPQPFADSVRRIELLDGEAYFQVHPDVARGFEVAGDHLLTRVLGTSFNIKDYQGSQRSVVSVITGKVSVEVPGVGENVILTAGQQVNYSKGTGRLQHKEVASIHALDWKDGDLSFVDQPLGDIAIELEHYYTVHIDFKYPGLRKYLVSAFFPHRTPLIDVLNTLCVLNHDHLTQLDAQHYVIH